MEWIAEPRKQGYFGGPSLKTVDSQSVMINHHDNLRDDRDVSMNYKPKFGSTDSFPQRLNGPVKVGKDVSLPRPLLSKRAVRRLRRQGIVPPELARYCNSKGLLPEAILAQYL